MKLCVRPETPDDYVIITEINDAAFGGETEGRLVEKLRATKEFVETLSLVAELDGSPVGHILFYPVTINSGETTCPTLALAPMSVLPEYQKKKIGSILVIAGLKKAQEMGYRSVIVLGHPEFYRKFAFKAASHWGITPPFEAPDSAFMALEIVLGELEGKGGVVEYPPAFDEAEGKE